MFSCSAYKGERGASQRRPRSGEAKADDTTKTTLEAPVIFFAETSPLWCLGRIEGLSCRGRGNTGKYEPVDIEIEPLSMRV